MSVRDFFLSVRTAAGLVFPTATVDSPTLDASRIEEILRGAHLWLTPSSVQGFNHEDFGFLPENERNRLEECVHSFREVASRVPTAAAASDEQVQRALPHFRGILEILRPDRYGDPDALILGKRLEQRWQDERPSWVRELRFETGEDANGDPAVWIWVFIEDDAARKEVFAENARVVREALMGILRSLEDDRWPYIRFRTVSEQNASHEMARR